MVTCHIVGVLIHDVNSFLSVLLCLLNMDFLIIHIMIHGNEYEYEYFVEKYDKSLYIVGKLSLPNFNSLAQSHSLKMRQSSIFHADAV